MFCKGIFKEALINVNQSFNNVHKSGIGGDEISLSVKIGEF
jgi:hypothetical protein